MRCILFPVSYSLRLCFPPLLHSRHSCSTTTVWSKSILTIFDIEISELKSQKMFFCIFIFFVFLQYIYGLSCRMFFIYFQVAYLALRSSFSHCLTGRKGKEIFQQLYLALKSYFEQSRITLKSRKKHETVKKKIGVRIMSILGKFTISSRRESYKTTT